jgi:hypothetical protein
LRRGTLRCDESIPEDGKTITRAGSTAVLDHDCDDASQS